LLILFPIANSALQEVFSDRGKRVSAILAFEFTPNQTRINPEGTPKVPRRYPEGTTKVLRRYSPGTYQDLLTLWQALLL